MDKIFVLLGKAGAGKTEIANLISSDLNLNNVVTCTSRPPRPGEIDGIHYYFKKYEDFNKNDFIEIEEFNGWKYGTPKNSFEDGKNYIIILTPDGYKKIKEYYKDRVTGIYIMAPREDRFNRYIERDGNVNEALRRFSEDDIDFYEFEYETDYIVINNKTFDEALNKVKEIVFKENYKCLTNLLSFHKSHHQ